MTEISASACDVILLRRLWYRQRKTVSSHSVAVGYLDAMPKLLNPGEKHPKFETLPTVIESINTRLRQFPLQGTHVLVFCFVFAFGAFLFDRHLPSDVPDARLCQFRKEVIVCLFSMSRKGLQKWEMVSVICTSLIYHLCLCPFLFQSRFPAAECVSFSPGLKQKFQKLRREKLSLKAQKKVKEFCFTISPLRC